MLSSASLVSPSRNVRRLPWGPSSSDRETAVRDELIDALTDSILTACRPCAEGSTRLPDAATRRQVREHVAEYLAGVAEEACPAQQEAMAREPAARR